MKESDLNDQVDFFKPPVPRARPPIRNINVTQEADCYAFKDYKSMRKSMYKTRQHNQEFYNNSNDGLDYTDDEEDQEDEEDEEDDISFKLFNASPNSSRLSNSFNSVHNSPCEARVYRRNIHSPNTSQSFDATNSFSFSHKVQKECESEGFCTKYCIMILIISICTVFFIVALNIKTIPQKNEEVSQKKVTVDLNKMNNLLDKSIKAIQTKFQNQKLNIWNDISAGIYDVVLFPKRPSIITLFGNETSTLNCLAQLLGQTSGNILGSNDYLVLTPEDFPNDVGQVIHKFKAKIIQKKAIIVQDLLNVNTEAIKAFHNFCDRENPLVGHAVYIITVIADGYKSSQRELAFIEKQLFQRLSKHIDKDILAPLVTRLTDGVIVPVLPEPSTNLSNAECSFSTNNKL